jgi:valyl-tRNA synthetase
MSNGGSYDPHAVEQEIYRFWDEGGHFRAVADAARRPYTIVIPPPNVTGALHMGHALNNTLQDVLIRRKRMAGFATLWLPGTDHAGIATQAVVEKRLREEQKLTRHQIGREGLVKKIWEWKEDYNSRILGQLRAVGCSCDWSRIRFTLDEVCARAVYETFFRFFKDGLIYRGLRLVNWDAALQTAVADDEIVHETVKGSLWHYRYPLLPEGAEGRSGETAKEALARATRPDAKLGVDYLVIATTRPETMLGDTAVAVHPDDERYQHLIGKYCVLPLVNKAIPIIGDGLLVSKEFGTGCVKVTPGHDPNDYAFAQRHGVEMINILAPDGKINENGGAYKGLDRYEARKKVVVDLEALGLMEKIEPYETEIGHSDRSKTPIEPMLSEQWFVKMEKLAETAMEAVRDGRIRFFPERYAKTYLDWLGEKRDWCISRQLWWGHRIPVWTSDSGAAFAAPDVGPEDLQAAMDEGKLICRVVQDNRGITALAAVVGEQQAQQQMLGWSPPGGANILKLAFCPRADYLPEFERLAQKLGMERDSDVLDTWFSSALWPHSTLGWPGDAAQGQGDRTSTSATGGRRYSTPSDLDYFYPTDVLCTAREIITLWVARMVMTGLYNVGRVPFHHVYIHPVIQDGQGRRMSKSLGNGVDPLHIIELFGTDAMRFTLTQLAGETQDIRMPVKSIKTADGRKINTSDRFELGRNFCHSLLQVATGFVFPNLETAAAGTAPTPLRPEDLAVEDRWILSRLAGCIEEVNRRLDRYQFNELANTLYAFFWSDFCDWYVELIKPRLYSKGEETETAAVARRVLATVLDQILRLLHPIVPFVTEALWKQFNEKMPQRGVTQIRTGEPALITAAWPDAAAFTRDPEVEREMTALQDVIRALRDTLARINTSRAAAKQPAVGKLPRAVIRADAAIVAGLKEQHAVLERLGRCESLEIGADIAKPADAATQVLTGVEVYVPLAGLMDLAAERRRLQKERDDLQGHIERLVGKLSNDGFLAKAPAAVVEQERARLAEMQERLGLIDRNLAEIAE